MSKELAISFGKDKVTISYEISIGNRKSIPYINEKELKQQCDIYSKKLKSITNFISFSIDYYGEDWYENKNFSLPSVKFKDNKSIITMINYDCIPKDWTESYSLEIKELANITILKKFATLMGINLTNQQLKDIRKSIKDKHYLNIIF